MANYLVNDTQLTSVANAIRAKSGGSAGLAFPSGFISEIGNISSGGGSTVFSGNDVVFYDDLMNDCKGGIAYSYSAADFAELTEMPANPDHSNFVTHGISIPMTSQGWNWSLADAKAHVAKYGKLNIGQMYIPTDGKSHWICYVPEDAPVERWNTEIYIYVESGSANWQVDDGIINTATENIFVTFPSVGWHDVKISAPSGVTYEPSSQYLDDITPEQIGKIQKIIQVFLGSDITTIYSYAFYCCYNLKSITIPNNITAIYGDTFDYCGITSITIPNSVMGIEGYAFSSCFSLTSITIPNGITSIEHYTFSGCERLASITIPDGVTNIDDEAFDDCVSLTSIAIPDTVTSIGYGAFDYCLSLTSIIIPDSVTSIDSEAFYKCYSLKNIIIENAIPPTLSDTNAFGGLMSDYSIIVPAGSLSAYTSATNWSSLADHIVEATA